MQGLAIIAKKRQSASTLDEAEADFDRMVDQQFEEDDDCVWSGLAQAIEASKVPGWVVFLWCAG